MASGEALEQMLQACEQDTAVTDEAMSDLKGSWAADWKEEEGR